MKSHATDPGMEPGQHEMANGNISMSLVKRQKKGGESHLGKSRIPNIYLSIVEITDDGTSEPMLATSL